MAGGRVYCPFSSRECTRLFKGTPAENGVFTLAINNGNGLATLSVAVKTPQRQVIWLPLFSRATCGNMYGDAELLFYFARCAAAAPLWDQLPALRMHIVQGTRVR